ncbi:hypothetical protein GCM10027422_36350 [Hymenobacter arcticus]
MAAALPVVLVGQRSGADSPTTPLTAAPRDSIVRFALRQVGTPYVYAGVSPLTGFDCSGFLQYVYAHFGVTTPHSTALLIDAGQPVARTEAQPGDIVVFTGTAEGSTTPGHAGIVISAQGETPLRFVHASSARRESGVKISQVEGSGYERRFMQVRRVLGGSASRVMPLARSPRVPVPTPTATPTKAVATLAPRPATVAALPVAPLPVKVAPLPIRARTATHARKTITKPTVHLAAKASVKKKAAIARPVRKAAAEKKVVAKGPATRPKSKK